LQERLMHVAVAKTKLGTEIPWLCDSMDNKLKRALGNAPNSEFVIGPDGTIVSAQQWSDPDRLREQLAALVGESDTHTSVRDLNLNSISPPTTAAKGVVRRLQLPGSMSPVQVTPIERKSRSGKIEPYYVKLRAEMDQRGEQLYLGLFLDPLHKVHWNNLTEPIEFSITTPDGVTVNPATGVGPKVEESADADPREFLVSITGESTEPLKLTVHYFACDDDDRFCKMVTQDYEIVLQRDPDGGSRRAGRRSGGGRSRAGSRMAGGPGNFNRMEMMRRMDPLASLLDLDGDGAISIDEIDRSIGVLRGLDSDGDGNVTMDELRRARARTIFGGQRPGR
jgi:hypothetical protein